MYANAIQSNQIDRSTLIEFESRFNRLFQLDSSGRINRRDESDSRSRSGFESNVEIGPERVEFVRIWSNLRPINLFLTFLVQIRPIFNINRPISIK